jgi:hypothetical protein
VKVEGYKGVGKEGHEPVFNASAGPVLLK